MSTMTASNQTIAGISPERIDNPRQDLVIGGAVMAAFLAIGVGWASLAPLGSAASAPGEIKVSGDRQSVQTLRGGIVSALHVAEGANVKAGDLLISFGSVEAIAEERALAIRVIDAQAEIARIEADRLGLNRVAAPVEFAALDQRDRAEADRALAIEQRTLDYARMTRAARQGELRSQIGEVGHQIAGSRVRREASITQHDLNQQELAGAEILAAKGYVAKTKVLALKRSAAAFDGDTGSLTADIARLNENASQIKMQMIEDRSRAAEALADRLRDARGELQTLLPQWRAARERLAQTEVRAPVSGAVVGLKLHTIGAVAAPGQVLMDVVPANRSLIVETHVSPSDVNQIRTGQSVDIRVPAVHDRSVPKIVGHVTRISADSMIDERTGRSFYTASIVASPKELDRFASAAGLAGRLKPGTPVDVQIPLRARTALEFWLEPLTQAISRAGAER